MYLFFNSALSWKWFFGPPLNPRISRFLIFVTYFISHEICFRSRWVRKHCSLFAGWRLKRSFTASLALNQMCMLMVWCFGRFLHLVFSHITVTLIRKWWNLSRRYCTPKLLAKPNVIFLATPNQGPGFYLRVCYSVEEYSSGSLSLKPCKSVNKSSRLACFCGTRGTVDLLGSWSWHWLIQKPSVNTETEWISVVKLGKWSDLTRVVRIPLKLSLTRPRTAKFKLATKENTFFGRYRK